MSPEGSRGSTTQPELWMYPSMYISSGMTTGASSSAGLRWSSSFVLVVPTFLRKSSGVVVIAGGNCGAKNRAGVPSGTGVAANGTSTVNCVVGSQAGYRQKNHDRLRSEFGNPVCTRMLPFDSCWYGTSVPAGPIIRTDCGSSDPPVNANSTGCCGWATPNRSWSVNVAGRSAPACTRRTQASRRTNGKEPHRSDAAPRRRSRRRDVHRSPRHSVQAVRGRPQRTSPATPPG